MRTLFIVRKRDISRLCTYNVNRKSCDCTDCTKHGTKVASIFVVLSIYNITNINAKMLMSEYFSTLPSDVKTRYMEKIGIIDCDPYLLKKNDFILNVKNVPKISYVDIYNYFALSHSFYTGDQIKAFKSLEAFKFYEAGFVIKMWYLKRNEHFLVLGEVKHSQRMSARNLQPWLIIKEDGSILSAHCTCMAGLGECCSHTAAVSFALHAKSLSSNEFSCTDKLAAWPVHSVSKTVSPKKIRDINWGKKTKSFDGKLKKTLEKLIL